MNSPYPPPPPRRSLWRSVILNALAPILLVGAGVGGTLGVERFEAAELYRPAAANTIVLEVPSSADDETYTISHNHAGAVAVTPDKPTDKQQHDCPPLVRNHLRIVGLWNDLQDIHQDLEPTGQVAAEKGERREKLDLARDRLRALMERLAPCIEEAPSASAHSG
jgi:hypothetical protein